MNNRVSKVTADKNPMSGKLNKMKHKWTLMGDDAKHEKRTAQFRKTHKSKVKVSQKLSETVNFLMGIQIPGMLTQLRWKERENQQLSAKLMTAQNELVILRKSIACGKVGEKIKQKNRAMIAELGTENSRLRADLKIANRKLEQYIEQQGEWSKIADEMTEIHSEQCVYFLIFYLHFILYKFYSAKYSDISYVCFCFLLGPHLFRKLMKIQAMG